MPGESAEVYDHHLKEAFAEAGRGSALARLEFVYQDLRYALDGHYNAGRFIRRWREGLMPKSSVEAVFGRIADLDLAVKLAQEWYGQFDAVYAEVTTIHGDNYDFEGRSYHAFALGTLCDAVQGAEENLIELDDVERVPAMDSERMWDESSMEVVVPLLQKIKGSSAYGFFKEVSRTEYLRYRNRLETEYLRARRLVNLYGSPKGSIGVPNLSFTPKETQLWEALYENAGTQDELAHQLGVSSNVIRNRVYKIKKQHGVIKVAPDLGYYRPDALPPALRKDDE